MEPLPPPYKLLNGTDYFRNYGDVTVGRGGERTLSHTFTFTLEEAGEVTLIPFISVLLEGQGRTRFSGEGIRVRFE